ncbi:MAG TPA: AMP-binding protein [Synergistaceae bacterium]|jgi:acyl-[acyl-carrier-protein]-phospholipid O-acyltransferase/long-chain-fatty-acid--[acyl-carrier-protein] ligase|nr:AMP-binding protein [Synergistaceae bacterium]NLL40811.1 AMP-binding protein [Synergistaceae bacterium]HPX04092.1 AMP-binding protein [Synergistaceae bacterium]HQA54045.1 AMP-binding protein [Synergistaceae bacterium]
MWLMIVKFFLNLFFRIEIKGWENWEKAGDGVLIAPNYVSFIDPLILAVFLPEKVPFAIERRLTKKKFIGLFLPLVETHILDADAPLTLKYFLNHLKNGGKCVIFPELQPTTIGNPMKVSQGVAMIADHTKAKILPINITGTELTPFSRIQHKPGLRFFAKVTINILPATKIVLPDDLSGPKRASAAGRALEKIMDEASLASRTKNKKFFDVLLDARKQYGGKFRIFCDHGQRPITYNGLITRILLIEDVLKTAGMEGDNVGVLLPTSIGGAVTIYALQKMGKVPAMLNFSLGGRSLVNCCRTACVKTVITSRKFVELGKFEALIAAVEEAGLRVIWLEDHASSITKFKKVSAALKTIFMRSAPVKEGETDKPAIILFTSGSEGAPKGVVLSYKNLLVNHAQMYTRVDFYRSDRILNTMPIFHSFGLCGVFMPVTLGIFVYFYPSPLHYKTISTICYDERITFLFATDTFLGGYAKAASDNYDFATIRMLVQGGEKLRHSTQEIWFERFSIRITEGYGVTEASPVVANNYYAHHRSGTVGQFVAGIEYRIEPVEGVHEGGRLWIKGPNVMLGYLRSTNPGVIDPPKDGWHDTGDIVSVDEDGFVRILGRAKRFAKIGGEMISLAAVEEVLSEVWPEDKHAVVMTKGGPRGETLSLVTSRPGLKRDELRQTLSDLGVAEIAIPKKILTLENIPLLSTGKIDYVTLEEILKDIDPDS